MITLPSENRISKDKNILIVLGKNTNENPELNYLIEKFCGIVVTDFSEIKTSLEEKMIYVCGNLELLNNNNHTLHVIKELSVSYQNYKGNNLQFTTFGEVPLLISNAGVYYQNMFGDSDYFNAIKSEHSFQELTESNKESKALRKGIYLTEIVKEKKDDSELLHFRLLRCSSNFTGPTDNFRKTDQIIVNTLNNAIKYTFEQETKVNHVLAQIYENKIKSDNNAKEVKSKIKAHSDKTKDMSKEGIIAFCTFYDKSNFNHLTQSKEDRYDWFYKKGSGLTKLHFKLKNTVTDPVLEKEFSVTLYPNSAFLIPLSTNRLYTQRNQAVCPKCRSNSN